MIIFRKLKAIALFTVIISFIVFGASIVVGDGEVTLVSINPVTQSVSKGETFNVNVSCIPGQPIKSFEFKLSFNALFLHANSVSEGDIFNGYNTYFNNGSINNTAGTISNIYDLILGVGNVSDSGTLVTISFTALDMTGISYLNLIDIGVTNEDKYLEVNVSNGTVTVEGYYTLTVYLVGSGLVTKNPNQASYEYNDVVTLTANANTGCTFNHWSGDLTGDTNPTTITINGNKAVTATFIDSTAPEINDIVVITSTPLDTNPAFGWVNITVDVTDNVEVNAVQLRIKNPSGIWNNVSMNIHDVDTCYYNSSSAFSSPGNYSYFIWTKDTSENYNSSVNSFFSMAPNYDINIDGYQNLLDLIAISNLYKQSGYMGWAREDVDNNGIIQVYDLVLISNYYGQSWWNSDEM